MPHYTFHRPISLLLSIFFAEGFVLDGLEEPVYSQGTQADRPFSWANFEDIPPALVARLRSVSP